MRRFLLPCLILWIAAGLHADTVNYTYDNAGRLLQADYGNGTSIVYTYDPAGNLLSRSVTNSQGAAASSDRSGKTKPDSAAEQTTASQPNRPRRSRPSAQAASAGRRTSSKSRSTDQKPQGKP
jgi:YD repeat-containing protein